MLRPAPSPTCGWRCPTGWAVAPASGHVRFARADEADTLRFTVTPPAAGATGEFRVTAERAGGRRTLRPGIRGRRVSAHPAGATCSSAPTTVIKVIDVRVPAATSSGLRDGRRRPGAAALAQLGADVRLLDADDARLRRSLGLRRDRHRRAGVRAAEDLRAYNHRLIEYAGGGRHGGRAVQQVRVQPVAVRTVPGEGRASNRVTDEHAPVTVLVPGHPAFNEPNRIGDAAWEGWVQERGLYFLGERDPQLRGSRRAVGSRSRSTPATKRGALVEAAVGKGRWVYVGPGPLASAARRHRRRVPAARQHRVARADGGHRLAAGGDGRARWRHRTRSSSAVGPPAPPPRARWRPPARASSVLDKARFPRQQAVRRRDQHAGAPPVPLPRARSRPHLRTDAVAPLPGGAIRGRPHPHLARSRRADGAPLEFDAACCSMLAREAGAEVVEGVEVCAGARDRITASGWHARRARVRGAARGRCRRRQQRRRAPARR